MRRLLVALPAAFFACSGSIDGDGAGRSAQNPDNVPVVRDKDGKVLPNPPGAGVSMGGPGGATGTPNMPGVTGPSGPSGPTAPASMAAVSGLHRLSVREYDNVLRDLLGDSTRPSAGVMPDDRRMPFDNDYTVQEPSNALVVGLNIVAREAVDRLMTDVPRRDMVVGCKPAAATDATCFRSFITRVGRLAFRRSLLPAEIMKFESLAALGTEGGDFYLGVKLALNAFLQNGNLVYRVERGTPVAGNAGLFKLVGTEVASRMSFFLWGSMPDDALLSVAEKGDLNSADGVRTAALRLLKDPRAQALTDSFHALWMGYETLTVGGTLAAAARAETAALMGRVIFTERLPWRDLFTFGEAFVNDTLARQYAMPLPGQATGKWAVPTDAKRRGLLGQLSFLTIGGSVADTSPTLRGKAIRNKLLCQEVPPPPVMVDVAEFAKKNPTDCKDVRYAAHRADPGCAACHGLMDPIGFGLENFDMQGRSRKTEPGKPTCEIKGAGEVMGMGAFSGPAELGSLLAKSGELEPCLVKQIYTFASGRSQLDANDSMVIDQMTKSIQDKKATLRLDDLMVEVVSSEAFRHRREEVAQ